MHNYCIFKGARNDYSFIIQLYTYLFFSSIYLSVHLSIYFSCYVSGGSGAGPSCLTGSGASQEDLSSLSSCQSNLDNIRPPTIMDDIDNMDHSMISVASLPPSEVDIDR